MLKFSIVFLFIIAQISHAQTGINTTTPDPAAALDVRSLLGNMNYGGLKIPIVSTLQKSQIIVNTASEGTLIYVVDGTSKCLEIYNGSGGIWQKIYCNAPVTLFREDFNSYVSNTGLSNGTNSGDYPSGVTRFTLTDLNNSMGLGDYTSIQAGMLEVSDTNGPVELETQIINIMGYSTINFSMDIIGSGPLEYDPASHTTDATNTLNDYVNVYYSINGGAYNLLQNYNGGGNLNHTLLPFYTTGATGTAPYFPNTNLQVSGLSGATLRLKLRFQNWASDEFFYVDNIVVTGQ
jgi:hypothetical protein